MGKTDDAIGVGAALRPGLAWSPNDQVALRTDGAVCTLVRTFSITYGDDEVAEWGRVWLTATLAVEATLP